MIRNPFGGLDVRGDVRGRLRGRPGQPRGGQAFVDGLHPALLVGGLGVLAGAGAAALIPRRRRAQHDPVIDAPEPALAPA